MLKYLVALISIFLASWLRQQVSNVRASAPVRMLTEDELSLYNGGENSKGLYLAILGQVFDVEKGRKHYGPGGGYHFFTGKGASRAFITGDFSGLTSDVSDFTDSQIVALYDWLSFYQRDYTPVGGQWGLFCTESGQPTDALLHVEAFLTEGFKKKAQAQSEMQLYPACNSEWSEASGGRVWCSTMSGGIHRDWIGVPRMLFSPGSGHSGSGLSDPVHAENRNLREYKDCPPHAEHILRE
uniref:Neuferricin n=1 Tax=Sinocyclocheilus anshuiensis TaxID=1608454 RepID=A0A671RSH0_9TELE